jgi:hypothetical protein
MAGLNSYSATLGPFDEAVHSVLFKCQCKPVCDCARRIFVAMGAAIRFSSNELRRKHSKYALPIF